MLTDEQDKSKTTAQNNPIQDHYDREFAGIADNYGQETDHPLGDKESLAAAEKKQETSPSGQNANNDTPTPESSLYKAASGGTGGNFFANIGNKAMQNKKASGGILGAFLAIVATVVLGISALGPLQFIHFSQMLQSFHLNDQEYNGNSRIRKLIIYAKTGDYNQTRLGKLANKHANKIDAKLAENGWKIDSRVGVFDGFTYDPGDGESKKGKLSVEEMKAKLESEGVKNVEIKNGKIKVSADGMKNWSNKTLIKTIYSGNRDVGRITSAAEKRLLIKRAGITWNPITKVDQKLNQKIGDFIKEEREKRLTGKAPPPDAKANIEQDPDGNLSEEERAAQEGDANAKIEDAKAKKLSAAGIKGFSGAAILCTVKALSESVDETKQLNAMIPMMQASAEVLGVGSKTMAGDNIQFRVLQAYAKSMHGTKDGKRNSWSGANSIRYEQTGKDGGSRLPSELNPKPDNSALTDFFNAPILAPLGPACAIAGNPIGGFVVDLATGGPASALAGVIFEQAINAFGVMDTIISLFVGEVPNLADDKYAGEVYGESANVGSRLVANETASAMGARVLTNAEEIALKQATVQEKIAENKNKSIIEKYFNPIDYETPVAKTIDTINPDNTTSTIASLPSTVLSNFSSLIAPKVSAEGEAKPSEVYYGIQKVGFTQDYIENPEYDNPYANAEKARNILNSDGKYVEWLKECNKINVIGLPDDLDFESEEGSGDSPAIINQQKLPDHCKNDGDRDFNFVRMAAFDTMKMKSLSCIEFDDGEACVDIGLVQQDAAEPGDDEATTQGGAFIMGDYAWPVGIFKKDLGTKFPCEPSNCHHDNTPAFDLYTKDASKSVGKPVYAIVDGEMWLTKVHNNLSGCYNFHIKGKDGYDYFYGHTQNPIITDSGKTKKVKKGDQVAEIGNLACGDNTIPHLHIDQSKETGHALGSRTDNLVTVLNKIYEKLPDEAPTVGGEDGWVWPIKGASKADVSFGWGENGSKGVHKAIDIPRKIGTPVLAVHDGKVIKSYNSGDCGYMYLIKATGTEYWYSYQHLLPSASNKKEGDTVTAGEKISEVGPVNGCGTGDHLHFGIEKTANISFYASPLNMSTDPLKVLP